MSFAEIAPLDVKLDKYLVVDVREPQERVDIGFVPTSINIPLAGVLDGTAQIPTSDKPLLVVCRSGARSAKACAAIAQGGRQNVLNLTGGTLGWIAAGLKVDF
ncbi:hypothetical protein BASA81_016516 [Batrachochytrium salamandrivorans]|nr:hypothetical protein BASA81_016516 [Batrachochytrium salamandrivorans]